MILLITSFLIVIFWAVYLFLRLRAHSKMENGLHKHRVISRFKQNKQEERIAELVRAGKAKWVVINEYGDTAIELVK